jgi:hypothetical protein
MPRRLGFFAPKISKSLEKLPWNSLTALTAVSLPQHAPISSIEIMD